MNRETFFGFLFLALALGTTCLSIHTINEHVKALDTRVSVLEHTHTETWSSTSSKPWAYSYDYEDNNGKIYHVFCYGSAIDSSVNCVHVGDN